MTGYEQLVKALRCKRDDCEGCDIAFFDKDEGWMCQYAAKDDDAASAIEALQAEVGKYHDAFGRLSKTAVELEQRVVELRELPKRGEWERVGDNTYKCTNCGEISCCKGKYCPDCGAKMEGMDASRPD